MMTTHDLPPGAQLLEHGHDRILELPAGHRNLWSWFILLVSAMTGIGGTFVALAGHQEGWQPIGAAVIGVVVAAFALRELLTRTTVVFARDVVTVEQRGPLRHEVWTAPRELVEVGEEVEYHKGQPYLELLFPDDSIELMKGMPERQVEQVRALLESWAKAPPK